MKKTIAILSALIRHNGFEHMRPMLVKFPHSCLFGTCKASSLAAPCKNSCVKIFRRIGSASSKRANFLQEKAKAQLIVCLLTSILTHDCDKFAFLNRMGFESVMPMATAVHAEEMKFYSEETLANGCKIVSTAQGRTLLHGYLYNDKYGVLDVNGNFIVEPKYAYIGAPADGRARFTVRDEHQSTHDGYFDENWNIVVEPKYFQIGSFHDGLAWVTTGGGADGMYCGYVDRDGNEVVPLIYNSCSDFKDGIATVEEKAAEMGYHYHDFHKIGHIDTKGNIVDAFSYKYMENHEDKEYEIVRSENLLKLNGREYDNKDLEYPFINYLGYSYIPLTYTGCRAMGISCDWSEKTGVVLTGGAQFTEPKLGGNTLGEGKSEKATIYKGKITIDGKEFTSDNMYYPMLSYKNVVYLPVLHRQSMEALKLEYKYEQVYLDDSGINVLGYMNFTRLENN